MTTTPVRVNGRIGGRLTACASAGGDHACAAQISARSLRVPPEWRPARSSIARAVGLSRHVQDPQSAVEGHGLTELPELGVRGVGHEPIARTNNEAWWGPYTPAPYLAIDDERDSGVTQLIPLWVARIRRPAIPLLDSVHIGRRRRPS